MRETGHMSAFSIFLFIEKEKGLVNVNTVYSECVLQVVTKTVGIINFSMYMKI